MKNCIESPHSFLRVVVGRSNPQGMRLRKSKTPFQGLIVCTVHMRQYTQVSCLSIHTYIVTYQASIALLKKPLGVSVLGYIWHVVPNTSPPRHPLTCTYMYKNRHTKTPMDTLTWTETTLRCLARVRNSSWRPRVLLFGIAVSAAPELGSRGAGGGARALSSASPTTRRPPRMGKTEQLESESRPRS
jgi:hypothetical protein